MNLAITLPNPIENIMSFIYDSLLDDQWMPFAAEWRPAAARVAFNLAFVTVLSSDDAATVASKGKARR